MDGFSYQTTGKTELWCLFVISFNKLLNKHLSGQLIEMIMWHHCNDLRKGSYWVDAICTQALNTIISQNAYIWEKLLYQIMIIFIHATVYVTYIQPHFLDFVFCLLFCTVNSYFSFLFTQFLIVISVDSCHINWWYGIAFSNFALMKSYINTL